MTSKLALLRIIPIVAVLCLGSFAGSVIAAGDTGQAEKVDCKKYPEHQDCKGKTN